MTKKKSPRGFVKSTDLLCCTLVCDRPKGQNILYVRYFCYLHALFLNKLLLSVGWGAENSFCLYTCQVHYIQIRQTDSCIIPVSFDIQWLTLEAAIIHQTALKHAENNNTYIRLLLLSYSTAFNTICLINSPTINDISWD